MEENKGSPKGVVSAYNQTDDKVRPPVVDAAYVLDLLARIRAARKAFQASSTRFEVLPKSPR